MRPTKTIVKNSYILKRLKRYLLIGLSTLYIIYGIFTFYFSWSLGFHSFSNLLEKGRKFIIYALITDAVLSILLLVGYQIFKGFKKFNFTTVIGILIYTYFVPYGELLRIITAKKGNKIFILKSVARFVRIAIFCIAFSFKRSKIGLNMYYFWGIEVALSILVGIIFLKQALSKTIK